MANKYSSNAVTSSFDTVKKAKRAKGRSNSYDQRQPRVATPAQKERQHEWRLACLDERASEGRLTDKNVAELERLEAVSFAK